MDGKGLDWRGVSRDTGVVLQLKKSKSLDQGGGGEIGTAIWACPWSLHCFFVLLVDFTLLKGAGHAKHMACTTYRHKETNS